MPAAPLLDLLIRHPFYDDQRCGDLAIAPTPSTATLLRRLQLTCKAFPDHASLYAGLDAGGAAIAAAAAPIGLCFTLSPRSPDFALRTDLAAIMAQAAPLFTNEGVAAAGEVSLRLTTRTARRSETLVTHVPAAPEGFTLTGRPLSGITVADIVVEGAGAAKGFAARSRQLMVDTSALPAGAGFRVSYPVHPDRPRDAVAEVKLTLDRPMLVAAGGPRSFVVPLAAAAARWVFYIVTDYGGDVATLRIVDAGHGTDKPRIAFSESGRVDLALSPDATDMVGSDLVRRNAGARVLRLVSDAPITARQRPLRGLELHLGDTRVIATLPNPRPDRLALLRTTAAARNASPETVLYEVLRLIAN
jgi:hypothetical protein